MKQANSPSRARILGRAFLAFLVVMFVLTVVGVPLALQGERFQGDEVYEIFNAPSTDSALVTWEQSQTDTIEFTAYRRYRGLVIHYVKQGLFSDPAPYQWAPFLARFGYTTRFWSGSSKHLEPEPFKDPVLLIPLLFVMELGVLAAGLVLRKLAEDGGEPLLPLFNGRPVRAIAGGIAIGLGLLVVSMAYQAAITVILGPGPKDPWDGTHSFGPMAKALVLVGGALLGPIAEEVYVRGYIFAQCAARGDVRFGLVASSLVFAALHLPDTRHFLLFAIIGAMLALSYRRTGSLLTPIAAHATNNLVALLLTFLGAG